MNERIQFIKDYLKKNGITYEQLSADSSTPVNTLKNIFSGRTEHPRIDTVQAIERALGITTDETQKSPQDELSEGEKYLISLISQMTDEEVDELSNFIDYILSKRK